MKADFYCAVMFPYPSAAGLHLGHYYNYAVIDSYCRWLRHRGTTVFQPFGYDAFGLPAENYARKVGRDPADVTYENIEQFRRQMVRMNTCYEERLVTCDPSYMKWTQWIFTRLHERGLAYKAWGEVNWCPSCETVLANEQVIDDHCERCGSAVERRDMSQWYFRITDYRDRLIAGLDRIEMPDSTKRMQRAWLADLRDWCVSRQRAWGCPIPIEGETDTLDTFVDSSFYYLRYLTDSETEFLPAGCYQPVDLYVGGAEHACMHLIYTRFIHMVLFDMGIVPQEEPFRTVIHQGVIRKDGAKMSKSKGNAVSPDDYDPDELRLYLMFIGPYFEGGEWSDEHLVGQRRFLARMRRWLTDKGSDRVDLSSFEDQVDRDVRAFKFNKVVSGFMEFYNRHKHLRPDGETARRIEEVLRVFAPGFSPLDSKQALSRREADASRGLIPVEAPDHHRDGRIASSTGMFGFFPRASPAPRLPVPPHLEAKDHGMPASELDIVRRAYARQMVGLLGIVNERLENAFAAVPRERFLGPEPWHVRHGPSGYVALPSNDPVYAYQDVLVALKQERGVNNGSPSLHARMMHALDPAVGSTMAHIGAGTGYYSAILAELVGPSGKVIAVEYDPALAEQAQANLAPWPNVDVVQGDGAAWPRSAVDGVYVNFAAERPADPWIERLRPKGHLVFPIGVAGRPRSPGGPRHTVRGGVLLVEKNGSENPVRVVSPASFVCAEGQLALTEEERERLAAAFDSGGAEFVKTLVWKRPVDPSRCWYAAADWALSYDPPQE